MENQPVVREAPLRARHERRHVLFDLTRRVAERQTHPMRHPKDVRVDREGRLFKCNRHHDVGGLPPDAGQAFQLLALARHGSLVPFYEIARGADDVFGFHAEEAARLDNLFHVGGLRSSERRGVRIFREQRRRRHVYAGVGTLGGKNDRDQQFERVAVLECGHCMRVRPFENGELALGDGGSDLLLWKRYGGHVRAVFYQASSNPCGVSTFSSPAAANAAGIELRAGGKLDEAIAAFRAAVLQYPQLPALHQNLAQTLYEAGDTSEAIVEHRRALAIEPRNVGSHLALYELLQMRGDRILALAHQRLALEEQRLFSYVAPHQKRSLLVLLAPGDWQANIPVDFLLDRDTTTVHKLYLLDEGYLRRDAVPNYDVMWNAIAESAEATPYLDLAARIMSAQTKATLNDPRRVIATSRLRLPDTLRQTGAHVPVASEMRRDALESGTLAIPFPIIARPAGSHAGTGLERLRTAEDCASYVMQHEAQAYFVSPFVDYASDDGFFRKYRIVFVDGTPFPVHLAISKNWMIHYYNAQMAENQWMRDEEARFLADLRAAFPDKAYETLENIARSVGLEYFGIDCSIDRDGRVLVFEADPAMLVHSSDPPELYPYKAAFVPRIYRAIEAMLDGRKAADT